MTPVDSHPASQIHRPISEEGIMQNPQAVPDYLIQSDAVRERFERLKARDVILDVRHVGKRFATPQGECVALDDISFRTHRREFVCVIGPSGCGKSTLIR
ncbi:ABC transporter related protein, partial [Burkholderia sp. TJI49]